MCTSILKYTYIYIHIFIIVIILITIIIFNYYYYYHYIYMYIHIMFLYPSKSTQLLSCSGNVSLRKRHHPLVASGAPHARCH